ncbi:hypothetical protein V7S43_003599 [Phytophthora oleae]|uniref:Uncharacterized protein n=1 Tax=Phytophthora oleae TaxID=2107226 RepID=A0ABD3G3A2_9STRA
MDSSRCTPVDAGLRADDLDDAVRVRTLRSPRRQPEYSLAAYSLPPSWQVHAEVQQHLHSSILAKLVANGMKPKRFRNNLKKEHRVVSSNSTETKGKQ